METTTMNSIDSRYQKVLEFHLQPVLKYFNDEKITDIDSNPNGTVFARYLDGKEEQLDIRIPSKSIEAVAALLAARTQNDISNDCPSIAARWTDPPLRVHIILPPAAEAPCFAIRRFATMIFPLKYYVDNGTCSLEQSEHIKSLINNRKNLIISGETGSGKTTLLNTLINEINPNDRLYIVEDTREIQCKHLNSVSVLTGGKHTTAKAIMDALRFRPDRIIVGEIRDGAALDMLDAWNTGHPGGLCSIHANSPDTVKLRLKSLIQRVSVTPQQDLIDATVDAVIQIGLCHDGKRRITGIKEFN